MAINDYHFITHWRVEGTVQDVYDILSNTDEFPRWWPAVYLDAREITPGNEHDLGRTVALHTRGWLPYTIWWQSRLIEAREPDGYTLEAQGDFVGRGIWTFEQDGSCVNITFDWRIRAEKPLLRYLSFLLKPVFAANHRWAMAKGEES
ncbi:MAG: polyketide cyclase, partial [Armatimonadota bacterium]|nr:polyketide cyclase [Armatimonadota bacterium]